MPPIRAPPGWKGNFLVAVSTIEFFNRKLNGVFVVSLMVALEFFIEN